MPANLSRRQVSKQPQTHTQNITYSNHLIELLPPVAYQLRCDIVFNFFKWETFSQLITMQIDINQKFPIWILSYYVVCELNE